MGPGEVRLCTKCGQPREEKPWKRGNSWCRACNTEYSREWRANNPDKESARVRRSREQRQRCKRQVHEHYGGACACCGEDNPKFLSVDHINGGGYEHRRTMKTQTIDIWLVNNGFPEGFQLLCYNCNCGKRVNAGTCPHQEAK